MKKILNTKILCTIIPYIFMLITSMVMNTIMFHIPFNKYFYISLLFVAFLVAPVLYMTKRRTMLIYLLIIYAIYTAFCCSNANYYLLFHDVFSLYYFQMVAEGKNVVDFKDIKFGAILTISSVYIIFIIVFLILVRKKEFENKYLKRKLNCVFIHIILLLLSILSLNITVDYDISINKANNFNEAGMMGYYAKEIQQSNDFFPEKLNDTYFENGEQSALHGMFKGYNVIEICIETGQRLMANPTLTPNLYYMIDNGLLTNNLSKNKTIESELIGILGSCPSYNMLKTDYYTPYSLPSILNDDYITSYCEETGGGHDVYHVSKSMPNIGFQKTFLHNDLYGKDREIWGYKKGNYILDSETTPLYMDLLLSDLSKPFYSYYLTLSMHGPYFNTDNDPLLRSMYGDMLDDAKLSGKWVNPLANTINEECIDHYMMACMDFDASLGIIINKLKEKNQFDNTLFVLYGDHNIFYNGKGNTRLDYCLANTKSLDNYKMYETIMLFYNSKFDFGRYYTDSYTSPYMIVPTILDLLGFNYYHKLYLSKPLFLESYKEEVFYSVEMSSFFNNHYFSNNGKTITKTFSNGDKNLFVSNMKLAYDRQKVLNSIYRSNTFKNYKYPKNYYI